MDAELRSVAMEAKSDGNATLVVSSNKTFVFRKLWISSYCLGR